MMHAQFAIERSLEESVAVASEQITAQPVRRLDMNRLRGHDLARNWQRGH